MEELLDAILALVALAGLNALLAVVEVVLEVGALARVGAF